MKKSFVFFFFFSHRNSDSIRTFTALSLRSNLNEIPDLAVLLLLLLLLSSIYLKGNWSFTLFLNFLAYEFASPNFPVVVDRQGALKAQFCEYYVPGGLQIHKFAFSIRAASGLRCIINSQDVQIFLCDYFLYLAIQILWITVAGKGGGREGMMFDPSKIIRFLAIDVSRQ